MITQCRSRPGSCQRPLLKVLYCDQGATCSRERAMGQLQANPRYAERATKLAPAEQAVLVESSCFEHVQNRYSATLGFRPVDP